MFIGRQVRRLPWLANVLAPPLPGAAQQRGPQAPTRRVIHPCRVPRLPEAGQPLQNFGPPLRGPAKQGRAYLLAQKNGASQPTTTPMPDEVPYVPTRRLWKTIDASTSYRDRRRRFFSLLRRDSAGARAPDRGRKTASASDLQQAWHEKRFKCDYDHITRPYSKQFFENRLNVSLIYDDRT